MSPPPCRPPSAMPCGLASPLSGKPQGSHGCYRRYTWLCRCPEQILGSPRVVGEICPGTPGPDRSVAVEEECRH